VKRLPGLIILAVKHHGNHVLPLQTCDVGRPFYYVAVPANSARLLYLLKLALHCVDVHQRFECVGIELKGEAAIGRCFE
jgi:hypothetical protein